ncbi:MAG: short-chain dehydrogenase [Acidobacteria bacterium]|nr:MAG: short-chain dehydrogenase [Acidobacteriota bacterium]
MQTCLVTGANSGIGRETARGLARLGYRVVLACRDPERGEAARRDIAQTTGTAEVELLIVDFARQASIRDFARAFLESNRELHVLVNNAGIWATRRRESPDGIELTWATNVLGYYLLTDLLLDRIRQSAPARIVNVASQLARDLDLEDVEFRRRSYSGVSAYAQSKQANRMLTWALARRLEGSAVTANAMHPGGVNTPLFAKGGGLLGLAASAFSRLSGKTPEEGADTVVWLASSPEVAGRTGEFWIDRRAVPCRFRDPAAEERLWSLCASMTRAAA